MIYYFILCPSSSLLPISWTPSIFQISSLSLSLLFSFLYLIFSFLLFSDNQCGIFCFIMFFSILSSLCLRFPCYIYYTMLHTKNVHKHVLPYVIKFILGMYSTYECSTLYGCKCCIELVDSQWGRNGWNRWNWLYFE